MCNEAKSLLERDPTNTSLIRSSQMRRMPVKAWITHLRAISFSRRRGAGRGEASTPAELRVAARVRGGEEVERDVTRGASVECP